MARLSRVRLGSADSECRMACMTCCPPGGSDWGSDITILGRNCRDSAETSSRQGPGWPSRQQAQQRRTRPTPRSHRFRRAYVSSSLWPGRVIGVCVVNGRGARCRGSFLSSRWHLPAALCSGARSARMKRCEPVAGVAVTREGECGSTRADSDHRVMRSLTPHGSSSSARPGPRRVERSSSD
jgi:hypothetical protein